MRNRRNQRRRCKKSEEQRRGQPQTSGSRVAVSLCRLMHWLCIGRNASSTALPLFDAAGHAFMEEERIFSHHRPHSASFTGLLLMKIEFASRHPDEVHALAVLIGKDRSLSTAARIGNSSGRESRWQYL